jgi:hypothetical protein
MLSRNVKVNIVTEMQNLLISEWSVEQTAAASGCLISLSGLQHLTKEDVTYTDIYFACKHTLYVGHNFTKASTL